MILLSSRDLHWTDDDEDNEIGISAIMDDILLFLFFDIFIGYWKIVSITLRTIFLGQRHIHMFIVKNKSYAGHIYYCKISLGSVFKMKWDFSVPYFVNGVSAMASPFKLFTKRFIDHAGDIARSHFNAQENLKSCFLWHSLSHKFTRDRNKI